MQNSKHQPERATAARRLTSTTAHHTTPAVTRPARAATPHPNPKDGSRIYIVLEYCAGGDLGHYIRRYGRVSEATARYFLAQLAEGLKELRRHNVIHVRCAVLGWHSS